MSFQQVRILTSGQTFVVDFLSGGSSRTVYSDSAGTSSVTLPATISADTTYYLPAPQEYEISVKLNGNEIADQDGTTRSLAALPGRTLVFRPEVDLLEQYAATSGTYVAGANAAPNVTPWAASTAYTIGQIVRNPSGVPVEVATAHTSTSSYDATKFSTPRGFVHWSPNGNDEEIKPNGDGRLGLLNWQNNDATAGTWLLHLTTTVNTSGGCIAIGVDGKGDGILVRNKATGKGIKVEQLNTVSSATAYAIAVDHQSATAPAVCFEQKASGTAVMLDLISYVSSSPEGTALTRWTVTAGQAGKVRGDGVLEWNKNVEALATVDVRDPDTTAVGSRYHAKGTPRGLTLWSSSGAANSWWGFRWRANGSFFSLQTAGTSSDPDAATYTTVIDVKNAQIGFFGTSPSSKRAATADATDLASVITLANALKADLVAYGLKTA